jgi:hypothetical protein
LTGDGAFGAAADAPGSAAPPAGPEPGKLAEITEEFLRQQAIFPAAVVARGDWLLGVVGTEEVHLMLYQLFVEANQPLPAMGLKQWSAKLTPPQRACLEALPPPAPRRDAVLHAMRAAAAEFRAQAREILGAYQVPWPEALDAAVMAYQTRELGWWAPGQQPPGRR